MGATKTAAKAAGAAAFKGLAPLAFMVLGGWLLLRAMKKGTADLLTPDDKERGTDTTSDDEGLAGIGGGPGEKFEAAPFSLPGPMPAGINGVIISYENNTSFLGSLIGNSWDVKVGVINNGPTVAFGNVQVGMEQGTLGPLFDQTDAADFGVELKPGEWTQRTVRLSTGPDAFGGTAFWLKINGLEQSRVS